MNNKNVFSFPSLVLIKSQVAQKAGGDAASIVLQSEKKTTSSAAQVQVHAVHKWIAVALFEI